MSALLELSAVTVAYGGIPAVEDVTLSVAAGTIVSVVGPNGAGKSTLLGAVMGEMSERLRAGRAVAAFPEGGTRDGTALGVFHARIFTAAVAADAPVQPVALCYGVGCEAQAIVAFAPRESFMGTAVRLLGEPARPARVCFLEPILHTEHAGRRGIAHTARERVARAMDEA